MFKCDEYENLEMHESIKLDDETYPRIVAVNQLDRLSLKLEFILGELAISTML